MDRYRAFAATLILLILVAGCGPAGPAFTPPRAASVPRPTAAPTPTPPPTPTPRPTATATPQPSPTPRLTRTPLPEAVLLEPTDFQWQSFNNCGPASLATVLAYYDHWITQEKVNEQVDPGPSACDIRDYVAQYGLMARAYEFSSSVEPVRRLLANHIPVIAGQRLSRQRDIGHYRVIRGYDDGQREFITDDPLLGPDYRIVYKTFAMLSRSGAFIPIYPPALDPLVQSLMKELGMHEIIDCPP